MGLRQILTFPDERLKVQCEPVEELTDEIQELIDDMADTMYAAPGIGLAAPQVGEQCRVIVFDCKELMPAFEDDCRFGYLMMQKTAQVVRDRLQGLRIESLAHTGE